MPNSPITPVKVNYLTGDILTAQNLNDEASAINRLTGYATQATANSTKTLVIGDLALQEFTGTTAGQIVKMPVVSTLGLGMAWVISNRSTQTIAAQSSDGSAIVTVPANTDVTITCILLTGTTAASWSVSFTGTASAASSGGMTLLSTTPITATASLTISGIDQGYKELVVVIDGAFENSGASSVVQLNSDASALYSYASFNSGVANTVVVATSTTSMLLNNGMRFPAGAGSGTVRLLIGSYSSATTQKTMDAITAGAAGVHRVTGAYASISAVTALKFTWGGTPTAQGNILIYGVK